MVVTRADWNFQTGGQVGETTALETALTGVEGIVDVQVDDRRGRLYLANSGMNRIEVFDFRNKRMLPPIEVGQFPRSMFDLIVGVLRWNYRVQAYVALLRDEYPPFSTMA